MIKFQDREEEIGDVYNCHYKLSTGLYEGQRVRIIDILHQDYITFFNNELTIRGNNLRQPYLKYNDNLYYTPCHFSCTLKEWYKQNKPINSDQIQSISRQIMQALYQLHSQTILGRCFNINNIYYTNGIITLTQFGFYSNLSDVPPEYLLADGYGSEIDMWLFGKILYYLMNGVELTSIEQVEDLQRLINQLKDQELIITKMLAIEPLSRMKFIDLLDYFQLDDQVMQQFYKSEFPKQQEIYNQLVYQRDDSQNTRIIMFSDNELLSTASLCVESDSSIECIQFDDLEGIQCEMPIIMSPTECRNQMPMNMTSQTIIIEQDPLVPIFLCTRNREQSEQVKFGQVWDDLHFLIYRFEWLQNSLEQLNHLNQNIDVILAKYFMAKMKYILVQEFLNNIKQKINITSVADTEWNIFITESRSIKIVCKDLQMLLFSDKQSILEAYDQLQTLDIKQCEIFKQVSSQVTRVCITITQDDINNTFADIKVPYRVALRQIYQTIGNHDSYRSQATINFQFYAKLRFQILCSILINRVFTNEREICFKTLKSSLKIDKLQSPVQVQQFLHDSCVDDIELQTQQLFKLYFDL